MSPEKDRGEAAWRDLGKSRTAASGWELVEK